MDFTPGRGLAIAASFFSIASLTSTVLAQGGGQRTPRGDSLRQAQQLDVDGKHAEARVIFQTLIDNAPDPANEAARVCFDYGDLATAEKMYRRGSELGLKEPEPKTHPKSLWDYRLAHALARIAAQKGDKAEAERQVAAARKILDSDPKMAEAQERFYPYLVGYVALFTNDLPKANAELTKAIAIEGDDRDPFMHALIGMTHEKMGHASVAKEWYQKAYDLATGHNPPAVFTRPFARKKLAGP